MGFHKEGGVHPTWEYYVQKFVLIITLYSLSDNFTWERNFSFVVLIGCSSFPQGIAGDLVKILVR